MTLFANGLNAIATFDNITLPIVHQYYFQLAKSPIVKNSDEEFSPNKTRGNSLNENCTIGGFVT